MDINKSTVYAIGRPDSTGEGDRYSVFDDNGQSYESKTMTYNFDTGRGFITDVITQQGEGYLTGGVTKRWRTMCFIPKTVNTPPATTMSIPTLHAAHKG